MKAVVELNSLMLKFFRYVSWFDQGAKLEVMQASIKDNMVDYMLQNSTNYFCLTNKLLLLNKCTILIQRKNCFHFNEKNLDSTDKYF